MRTHLTFFTVVTLVTSIANAGPHQADPVSSTVDVNALVGRYVTFHTLPPAVALAAAVRVLAVTVAENRTGNWNTKQWNTSATPVEGSCSSCDQRGHLPDSIQCRRTSLLSKRRRDSLQMDFRASPVRNKTELCGNVSTHPEGNRARHHPDGQLPLEASVAANEGRPRARTLAHRGRRRGKSQNQARTATPPTRSSN